MSDQPTSVVSALPMADILPLVLQYLSKDLASLCACALLNRNSNRAASAVLYRHIVFAPPWTTTLDLKEARKYSVRSQHAAIAHKIITHRYQTTIRTSATRKHTALRRTPALCRLREGCRNRGYDRSKIRKRRFKIKLSGIPRLHIDAKSSREPPCKLPGHRDSCVEEPCGNSDISDTSSGGPICGTVAVASKLTRPSNSKG